MLYLSLASLLKTWGVCVCVSPCNVYPRYKSIDEFLPYQTIIRNMKTLLYYGLWQPIVNYTYTAHTRNFMNILDCSLLVVSRARILALSAICMRSGHITCWCFVCISICQQFAVSLHIMYCGKCINKYANP